MFIEDKAVQILRSQWHVDQHGDGERGLRLGQRAKILLLIALDLRPQTCRQIAEPLQYGSSNCRMARLFLGVKPAFGIGTLLVRG